MVYLFLVSLFNLTPIVLNERDMNQIRQLESAAKIIKSYWISKLQASKQM